jgi:hypothetical protein
MKKSRVQNHSWLLMKFGNHFDLTFLQQQFSAMWWIAVDPFQDYDKTRASG